MGQQTTRRRPGDRGALGALPRATRLIVRAILGGDLACTPCWLLPCGPEGLAEAVASGWVALWERNGGASATLTPLAAERLRVHLVDVIVPEPREKARERRREARAKRREGEPPEKREVYDLERPQWRDLKDGFREVAACGGEPGRTQLVPLPGPARPVRATRDPVASLNLPRFVAEFLDEERRWHLAQATKRQRDAARRTREYERDGEPVRLFAGPDNPGGGTPIYRDHRTERDEVA